MLFDRILVFLSNSSKDDNLAEEMGDLTRAYRGFLIGVRPKIISRIFPEDVSLSDLNKEAEGQLSRFGKKTKLKEGRRLRLDNPQSRDLNSVVSMYIKKENPDLVVIPYDLIFDNEHSHNMFEYHRLQNILRENKCSLLIWKQ